MNTSNIKIALFAIVLASSVLAENTVKGTSMLANADKNKTKLVIKTIASGIDTNDIRSTNEYNETPLIVAARNDNFELVKALLDSKVYTKLDVLARDVDGNSALMYAVNNKNVKLMQLLGAYHSEEELSKPNANKESAVSYAKKIGGDVATTMEAIIDTAHKATLVQIKVVQSAMPMLRRGSN